MNPATADRLLDSGVDAQNPWPGLVAYTEDSTQFFHGRTEETEDLLGRVGRKNLTVLFGQSGLGKSSLLQAGLFPRLRLQGYLPIVIRLDHSPSSPSLSEQVNSTVTTAIRKADGGWDEASSVASETLWERFHKSSLRLRTSDGRPIRPVLVLDQFEELFAIGQTSEEARSRSTTFLMELADFVENRAPAMLELRLENEPAIVTEYMFDDPDFRVLISLREDYLAHLESLRHTMPSIAENRMRLTRLNGTRAMEAVLNPGRDIITPPVAAQVVQFVAGGGVRGAEHAGHRRNDDGLANLEVEPSLLSLVCRELNNRRLGSGLPQISSDLVAGNRERILQDFYDECLADQPAAVRIFVEDVLVTDSGLRENIALESAIKALARLGAAASAITDLVKRRLIRLEDRLAIQRVELTHDVLTAVVKRSRDERQSREATVRAQQQAQEARENSKRQRRKLWIVVSSMAALLLIGSGLGVGLFIAYREARQAYREARQQFAEGLILQGDALRVAGRSNDARNALVRSLKELNALGQSPLRAELVLWNLYYDSPPELMTFAGHTEEINSVAFSPDGRWALSGSGKKVGAVGQDEQTAKDACKDPTVRLWDLCRGVQKQVLIGHSLRVNCVCFSHDGRWALSGSDDTTVKLWDLNSGKEKWTLAGHRSGVRCVCFSRDGRWALSGGGADQTAKLWDLESGAETATFSGHDRDVTSVAFSPDGRTILSGSADKTVKQWNPQNGEELRTLTGHGTGVTSVAFSPSSRIALSASLDHELILWDLESGEIVKKLLPHSIDRPGIAFSLDGTKALSTGTALRYSGSGRIASSGGADTVLTLRDLKQDTTLRTISAYTNQVSAVALSPDCRMAFVGTADNTLKLFDIESGHEARSFDADSIVTSVAFAPDGLTALSGGLDNKLKLWDLESGKELRTFTGHEKPLTSVAFSPTRREVLSGAWDSTMRLWGIDNGEELYSFRAAEIRGRVAGVAFAPDGRTALSGSDDRTLELWDRDSFKKVRTLSKSSEQYSGFRGVAISHDGSAVLACSTDATVKLWDLASDHEPRTFSGHKGAVNCVTFSPDGRLALSGGLDRTIKLWDIASGKEMKTLTGHEASVNSIAISADGATIISGGNDNVLTLWDAESGSELLTLNGHTHVVNSVALYCDQSATGKIVAALSGSSDKTMRLWIVGRANRYLEFDQSILPRAHTALSRNPKDPEPLAVLGSWYAFRGVHAWAVDLLEAARSDGASVSALMLARSYWERRQNSEARREFERALGQNEAPADYLKLCLAAIASDNPRPAPNGSPRGSRSSNRSR